MITNAKNVKNANRLISICLMDALSMSNPQVKNQKEYFIEIISDVIVVDQFYLKVDASKKISAAIGLQTSNANLISNDFTSAKQKLGFFQRKMIIKFIKSMFISNYPKSLDQDTCLLGLILNNPKAYHKEAINYLIKEIIKTTPYQNYIIEVSSNNVESIKTYQALGFKECLRIKNKNLKLSFTNYIYLQYTKDGSE